MRRRPGWSSTSCSSRSLLESRAGSTHDPAKSSIPIRGNSSVRRVVDISLHMRTAPAMRLRAGRSIASSRQRRSAARVDGQRRRPSASRSPCGLSRSRTRRRVNLGKGAGRRRDALLNWFMIFPTTTAVSRPLRRRASSALRSPRAPRRGAAADAERRPCASWSSWRAASEDAKAIAAEATPRRRRAGELRRGDEPDLARARRFTAPAASATPRSPACARPAPTYQAVEIDGRKTPAS